MKNKKGNIEIIFLLLFIIVLIVFLSIVFILYVQINSNIYVIKNDLFYIVQSSYISLNIEELAFNNYIMNQEKLFNDIKFLLSLNFPSNEIIYNYIIYDENSNCVKIDLNLIIKPLVLKDIIKNIKLNIKDEIKIKLMEVK